MTDRWALFRQFWNLSDDDPIITDAEQAIDPVAIELILRVQGIVKEITDSYAQLSKEKQDVSVKLNSYHETVILALAYLRDGNVEQAQKELQRMV